MLPSRSQVEGADNDRAVFVQKLREEGTKVEAPLCDIADRTQLEQTIYSLKSILSPIRGCIQSAMVLQDSSFQNMTSSRWQTALAPKLAGSWNLHELLPKDMSFFVMLASQAGIAGPFGQANYAAGNTYQDALSAHRIRHSLPSVSIDLGTVASVGYVSENAHVKAMMRTRGVLEDLSEEDVLALLEHYCSPDRIVKDESKAQVITGIPFPAELRAQGVVEPVHLTRPLLRHLHTIVPSQSASSEISTAAIKPASALLEDAKTLDGAITDAIRIQLSNLLVVDKENNDTAKPIYVFGVDSLAAVEMRNWFARGFGADVSLMEILGGEAIRDLAVGVARKSRFVSAELKS